ncbi:MAG TPA: hypothetical protein VNX28_11090 [Gemmataceae bacterium]|jgi:hypothetical protein|nr:hypothetical protein [Gemmataceae bacterium]
MRRALVILAALAVPWLGRPATARGHAGSPFPIIVDRPSGPYVISVWADPDVGIGTFYVILAPAPGTTLHADIRVEVGVQPTNGRLAEACYPATRQNMPERVQYYAEVKFDREEMWQVRVRVTSAGGSAEVTTLVEATPPGFGAWDLLIYGLPFILFGTLWFRACLCRPRA